MSKATRVLGILSIAIAGLLGVVGIVGGIGILLISLLYEATTNALGVNVDVSVYERGTTKPVSGCLLSFSQGVGSSEQHAGARTDASGHMSHRVSYYTGGTFPLSPFRRVEHPHLRFFLGEGPRYGTFDQAETWDVTLGFRQPFSAREVKPEVQVKRSLSHEEVLFPPPGKQWQQAASVSAAVPPADALVVPLVRFEADAYGRTSYRVPLSLYLDRREIALCQAPSSAEVQGRAGELFKAHQYADALGQYREAARLWPDRAWPYQGMGASLGHLRRSKESTEAYRKAAELDPRNGEIQYWYANSLLDGRFKDAADQFKKVTEIEPGNARGFIGLGGALSALGRYPEACAAYETAERLCADCLDDADRQSYAECKRRPRR